MILSLAERLAVAALSPYARERVEILDAPFGVHRQEAVCTELGLADAVAHEYARLCAVRDARRDGPDRAHHMGCDAGMRRIAIGGLEVAVLYRESDAPLSPDAQRWYDDVRGVRTIAHERPRTIGRYDAVRRTPDADNEPRARLRLVAGAGGGR